MKYVRGNIDQHTIRFDPGVDLRIPARLLETRGVKAFSENLWRYRKIPVFSVGRKHISSQLPEKEVGDSQ
jgi:hypothetical protein